MSTSRQAIFLVHRALLIVLASTLGGHVSAGEPGGEPAISIAADNAGLVWGPCPEFFGDGCDIAVLHGDPTQPNSDVLFRLAGRQEFPPHRHTSAERMVLISGMLQVTYEGQDPVNLSAGDYAFGPPERVHHGQCVSDEPCVLFIAFEQPVDASLAAMP